MVQTPGRAIRVLCIDDNLDVSEAMRLLIEAEPSMECVGCLSSAANLVAEVRGRDPLPDVVVMDPTMPGPDPLTAMKDLNAQCPSVRTIIYSGHDDPETVNSAMNAGAWGYLSKNAEPMDLVRALHDVAAGRVVWPG